MTQPLLEYQSPTGPSRIRIVTWIVLVTLGSLYFLGSLCTGISFVVTFFGVTPPQPDAAFTFMVVYMIALSCGAFGTAVTYFWTGLLIRRRSRRAAVVALVAALINVIFILAVLAIAAFILITRGNLPLLPMILGVLFYAFVAAVNGTVAWLLTQVLREHRQEGPK
jgi:hypothetical protein